jgi:putative resolvase
MKLAAYARKAGVTYKTAYLWFKAGKLKGYQMDTGTIIIEDDEPPGREAVGRCAVYARVSSHEQREDLERQAERLTGYCTAKGWQIHRVVKEVGSGVNDNRKRLLELLADPAISVIVVEHKDRLTRFGFNYISTLLAGQGRRVEVVNLAEDDQEDLLTDLVSIIYSFCARLYGQRRARRKTERITLELERADD